MPATTPPKGRPTTGRRDRQVARHRSRSRSSTKRFVWAVVAIAVLAALLVLGTGTGGNGLDNTTTNAVLPLLLLSRWRPELRPDPRS